MNHKRENSFKINENDAMVKLDVCVRVDEKSFSNALKIGIDYFIEKMLMSEFDVSMRSALGEMTTVALGNIRYPYGETNEIDSKEIRSK